MPLPDTMNRVARRFADKIVRTYAVAALAGAGFFGAADALAALEDLADDNNLRRARCAVAEAVVVVLASPPRDLPGDRALLALMAAREAVALASGPIDAARLRDLEETLAVSAEAAGVDVT
jgi:hypothetical protein